MFFMLSFFAALYKIYIHLKIKLRAEKIKKGKKMLSKIDDVFSNIDEYRTKMVTHKLPFFYPSENEQSSPQ